MERAKRSGGLHNAVQEDWGYGLCARGAAPIRSSTEGALRGKGRTR